jgi:apoptosis-inducing factor 3
MREVKIAEVSQLLNGEMKAFPIDDENKILLIKTENKIFAAGSNCTHYGAPLDQGSFDGETIICPWHHACFYAKTGELCEPPARDYIHSYEVRIENEDIFVKLPENIESAKTPVMARLDENKDQRNFVIIGGGAAGNAAAQSMREHGFEGKILMITADERLPYDRPNLSKDYLSGEADPAWMPLRPKEFFDDHEIEILFKKNVDKINPEKKTISFNGEEINYDKLLIATGGIPKKLDIPGKDLNNIFYLRSFGDSDRIIEAAKNSKRAVVVGASFIAMECAWSLHERGIDVTVAAPEDIPFKKVFGEEIGNLFKNEHAKHGIKFKLEKNIESFEGEKKLGYVVLSGGEKIPTDFVVVGIGVKPATDFLKTFNLEKDGGINVNSYLQIEQDIYAAGDIARFNDPILNRRIRIEHWRTAEQQGRLAGMNMAGNENEYNSIPFFWTAQAGLNLRYVGHAEDWDEITTWGKISDKNFISFFIKDNKIAAAAGIGKDTEMAAIHHLFRNKNLPEIDQIKQGEFDLTAKYSGKTHKTF